MHAPRPPSGPPGQPSGPRPPSWHPMAPQPPQPRPPSLRPSEPPPEAVASWVTRFGTLTSAGTFAAALATIPAALRASTASDAVDAIGAWIALVGVAILPCVFAAWFFRGAYQGLRAFAGEGMPARAAGIALWLALVIAGLTAYAAVLRATTHHHGLAGTTFAIGALVMAVGGGAVAGRIGAFVQQTSNDAQRVFAGASFLLLFAVIGLVASRLAHGGAAPVVDALALLLALVFVGQPTFTGRRALAIVGPPIAATFVVLGVATLRGSPALRETVPHAAPIFGALVSIVAGR